MAETAIAPHAAAPLPMPSDDWRDWFLNNTRSFRRTLLIRRDGAKLHAGTQSRRRGSRQDCEHDGLSFASGLRERDAQMAMLASSYFTVGSVLEEQSEASLRGTADDLIGVSQIDHEAAFEEGLKLILDGLAARVKG